MPLKDPLLAAMVLFAAILLLGAARERIRLREVRRTQATLRAATPQGVAPGLVPLELPSPSDHLGDATGWILATANGTCAVISDSACVLLGVRAAQIEGSTRLGVLLRDGEQEASAIFAEINERRRIQNRRVHPAAKPSESLELAGVALRDRHGQVWGSALLIRPCSETRTHP
jgi:hypothetical protein